MFCVMKTTATTHPRNGKSQTSRAVSAPRKRSARRRGTINMLAELERLPYAEEVGQAVLEKFHDSLH